MANVKLKDASGTEVTYNGVTSVTLPTADGGIAMFTSTAKADKTDLASIMATGSTNTTGAAISSGTYFYLNDVLVRAKTDIATGATFTSGTNYETVTAGALNELKNAIDTVNNTSSKAYTFDGTTFYINGTDLRFLIATNMWFQNTQGLYYVSFTSDGNVYAYNLAGNNQYSFTVISASKLKVTFTTSYPGTPGQSILDITGRIQSITSS